jgi:hypothetical protein
MTQKSAPEEKKLGRPGFTDEQIAIYSSPLIRGFLKRPRPSIPLQFVP